MDFALDDFYYIMSQTIAPLLWTVYIGANPSNNCSITPDGKCRFHTRSLAQYKKHTEKHCGTVENSSMLSREKSRTK